MSYETVQPAQANDDQGEEPRANLRRTGFVERGAEVTLGAFKRPRFTEAPAPDYVRAAKSAVGLAVSFRLGG